MKRIVEDRAGLIQRRRRERTETNSDRLVGCLRLMRNILTAYLTDFCKAVDYYQNKTETKGSNDLHFIEQMILRQVKSGRKGGAIIVEWRTV